MIPPGFPVFTGDSADFGRQVGLFCQALCTLRTDSVRVSRPVLLHGEGHAFEGENLGQPVEVRVSVQYGEAAVLGGRCGD